MDINIKGAIVSDSDAWIYDYFGMPCVCPSKVDKAMKEANGEPLDIYINSGGGSVFSGSEIYSLIRAYKGTVNIHVTGLAASAASVIACAGHSDISPTAQLMVHNVSSYAEGDYREMDSASEMLKQANRAIAAAYVDKTGMSEEEALELMDKETWITAKDAIEIGLIDELAKAQNDNRMVAAANGMIPATVIDKYNQKKADLIDYFS